MSRRVRGFIYEKLMSIDQIDNEFYEDFFLTWWRARYQKCESDESRFIDFRCSIFLESMFVFIEKPYEEECSDPFVPIGEWMILDNEIEEMSCLLFNSMIEILSIESLYDTFEYSYELRIFFISEEFCGSSFLYKN